MPENITTVLNLTDADFGSGGFSNPADNRVYILQGEGSDRDRLQFKRYQLRFVKES